MLALCRYFVLFHLPQLKFLDSSAVEQAELTEAKRRGQFMHVVRPTEHDAEVSNILMEALVKKNQKNLKQESTNRGVN